MLDYFGPDSKNSGRLTKVAGFNEKFSPKRQEQGMKNEATYSSWTSRDGLDWQKMRSATLDPHNKLIGNSQLHGAVGTKTIDEDTGEQGFSLATCGCWKGHCCPEHTKCEQNGMRHSGRTTKSVPVPERTPAALTQFISEVLDGKTSEGDEPTPATPAPTPIPATPAPT